MIGGRLKIVNESAYPTAEVETLVRFGLEEIDVRGSKLLAYVRDLSRREYRGYGGERGAFRDDYPEVYRLARTHGCSFVALMMVGAPTKFPIVPFRRNGNVFDYRSWDEALVGITAHEGKHVQHAYDGSYQTKSGTRRATRWSRGTSVRVGAERVEPKCEAFELGTLRRYRTSRNLTAAGLSV